MPVDVQLPRFDGPAIRGNLRGLAYFHVPENEADVIERIMRITELDPGVVQKAYDYWFDPARNVEGVPFSQLFFPEDGMIAREAVDDEP